ncbi:MAG: response regulator [Hyphomicrobiaceae bacterium]
MTQARLRDMRILIVEDEHMLGAALKDYLEGEEAVVIGPVARLSEALAIVTDGQPLDGAVIDVNLAGEKSHLLAEALRSLGIRCILTTGERCDMMPAELLDLLCLEKPFKFSALATALVA